MTLAADPPDLDDPNPGEPDDVAAPSLPARRRGFQDTPEASFLKEALAHGVPTSTCPQCHSTVAWSRKAGPAGHYGVCAQCLKEFGRLRSPGEATSRCPQCGAGVAYGTRVVCLACGYESPILVEEYQPTVTLRRVRERVCRAPRCGKAFQPGHPKAKFCSDACRVRASRAKPSVTIQAAKSRGAA